MELEPPVWELRAAAPELPAGVAHLWRVRAGDAEAEDARWRELLDSRERERLARFRFAADARREAISRGALRELLGSYLGIPSREVAFTVGPQGKPAVTGAPAGRGIEFNVSHSGDWVLLAFARGGRVGIDIERWREIEAETILRDFFRPEEAEAWRLWPEADRLAAFFSIWTLKEAYVKALGAGLAKPLQSFHVRFGPAIDPTLAWCAEDPDAAERWRLTPLDVGAGYSAALASEREIGSVRTFTLPPR
jgi:4'-phosphopantetheinyl transferase